MFGRTARVLVLAAVGVLAGAAILWAQPHGAMMPKMHAAATMPCCDANSPMMKECAEGMRAAADAVGAAQKALASGDTKTAAAELEKAQKALASIQEGMGKCKCMAAPAPAATKVVNARCPIMGGEIDPAKAPADLVRMYKGQSVGFCCGGCPPAWDKLTDAEKDAKLAKALAK